MALYAVSDFKEKEISLQAKELNYQIKIPELHKESE